MGNHFALAIQTKYQAKCRDLPLKQNIKMLIYLASKLGSFNMKDYFYQHHITYVKNFQ